MTALLSSVNDQTEGRKTADTEPSLATPTASEKTVCAEQLSIVQPSAQNVEEDRKAQQKHGSPQLHTSSENKSTSTGKPHSVTRPSS